jgi:hypothetical protein
LGSAVPRRGALIMASGVNLMAFTTVKILNSREAAVKTVKDVMLRGILRTDLIPGELASRTFSFCWIFDQSRYMRRAIYGIPLSAAKGFFGVEGSLARMIS